MEILVAAADEERIQRRRQLEENIALWVLRAASALVLFAPIVLIVYLGSEAARLFLQDGVSPATFLFTPVFDPDNGRPGVAAFIAGSIAVTVLAVVISTICGLGVSIYLAEFSGTRVAAIMQAAIEMLAGIPSVVFGWLGLTVLVPLIRQITGTAGFGILSASLVLSVMILPTLVALAVDALRAVPRAIRESSFALGATMTETIARIVLPAARDGILVAIILATARAVGETLAVQMVIGNAGVLPRDLLHAAATLPTEIVIDMGSAPPGSLLEHALFAAAFVLLVLSTALITLVRFVMRRKAAR